MATKKLTSAQQARENLKRKNPKYKAYREKKELARAERDAKIEKIKNLVIAGKDREAYREFETLPLLTQATVLVTPVIGDAIAAYEVGEFGTRAEERFAQNDILGGLGNRALQTMAGLSLVPAVGIVGDFVGKGLKGLGRVAKTDPDMPAGGGSSYSDIPNEYVGTRPVDIDSDYGLKPGTGLISPNRLALSKIEKPMKLDSLVAQLRKAAPNKEGELRMLGLLDESNQITPVARKYFAGQEKVSPAALDQYLSLKQRTSLNVMRPDYDDMVNPGYEDIDTGTEVQRIYQVEGVSMPSKLYPKASGNRHYRDLALENDIAFDTTDEISPGTLRVGRIQSDYDPFLKHLRQINETDNTKAKDIDPFNLPDRISDVARITDDKEGTERLKKLFKNYNFTVSERNDLANSRLSILYGDRNRPTTDYVTVPKLLRAEEEKIKRLDEEILKLRGEIGSEVNSIEDSLGIRDELGFDIAAGNIDFVRTLAIDKLPRAAKIIAEREKNYGTLDFDKLYTDGRVRTRLDPQYYRFDNDQFESKDIELDLISSIDPVKTLQKLDEIKVNRQDVDLEYDAVFNEKRPKLDPYASVGAKSTKSYVLPVRNLMNEALQNDGINNILFETKAPLEREGGIESPLLKKYYDNVAKEAKKVVNELVGKDEAIRFIDTSVPDDITIDMYSMRKYMEENNIPKKISAFKSGGLANIDSLLNNL